MLSYTGFCQGRCFRAGRDAAGIMGGGGGDPRLFFFLKKKKKIKFPDTETDLSDKQASTRKINPEPQEPKGDV